MEATTTEHPILFKGNLVRAIRAGLKTQTRRPLKDQPPENCKFHTQRGGLDVEVSTAEWLLERCKYKAGDHLWVRESWRLGGHFGDVKLSDYNFGDTFRDHVHYRADEEGIEAKWRPSIHLPRWAARILLEITQVRIEQIQDITEDDVCAEGITNGVYLTEGQRLMSSAIRGIRSTPAPINAGRQTLGFRFWTSMCWRVWSDRTKERCAMEV